LSEPSVTRLPYLEDPRPYFELIRDLPWPVWLDSGFPRSGAGRYDVIAADPFASLTFTDGYGALHGGPSTTVATGSDPFSMLRDAMGASSPARNDLPFGGGAIGYLAYDLARTTGQLPPRPGMSGLPEMAVGLYDWSLVIDHARRRSYFVSSGRDTRQEPGWPTALRRLRAASRSSEPPVAVHGTLVDRGMTGDQYAERFARVQDYILAGDCYQVNLAQRFCAHSRDDPWTVYQRMRLENPSPYGAFLDYPFGQVLSSSPERFLRVRGRQVTTRPIKGTRPRGERAADDLALRAQLVNSTKDRAENLMIVDLLRNDLGRVCEPGTIEVPGLFEVESFATVHHLVSTVTGRLRPECDAIDLLQACFPGGSITGAPKLRAMQIIDELEPQRRENYCGNIIRLGFDGDLDSSIMIRTALMRDSEVHYWAGGGIVADSVCTAEYQESLDKAAAFFRLFQLAL
jgi:para-aminobenzoate synthetase component 1